MNRMYLLHIHLSTFQRMTPLPRCPNNFLSATYLIVFRIDVNMPDMHVRYTDSPYHCGAIAPHQDDGEPERVQVRVLLTSHHNCLTSTTLPPFVNTNPRLLQDRAIPVLSRY